MCAIWSTNQKNTMKTAPKAIASIIIVAAFALGSFACSNLTPQQKSAITTVEKLAGVAATIGAQYEGATGNTQVANDLYAVAAVATAYGNAPVPASVLAATVQLPQVATIVAPLVTKNGAQSQAIINGAAALVGALQIPNASNP
jgi:hypothetical protein